MSVDVSKGRVVVVCPGPFLNRVGTATPAFTGRLVHVRFDGDRKDYACTPEELRRATTQDE